MTFMSNPQFPDEMGPQKRSPQVRGTDAYDKGDAEIDAGGVSQTHKGYGRGGNNQPRGRHVQSAPARYSKDSTSG